MKRGIIMLLTVIVAATASLAAQETAGSPTTMSKKELRRTMRGYKAFYEAGHLFAFEAPMKNDITHHRYIDACDKFSFTTSQGFQVNNFFYMGFGIELDYYWRKEIQEISVPVFLNLRVNFLNKRFSPFADFRIGGNYGNEIGGFYIAYQLGLRYALPRNHAIFVCAENSFCIEAGWSETDNSISNLGYKIGYEF